MARRPVASRLLQFWRLRTNERVRVAPTNSTIKTRFLNKSRASRALRFTAEPDCYYQADGLGSLTSLSNISPRTNPSTAPSLPPRYLAP
jgi:hypothetical protein